MSNQTTVDLFFTGKTAEDALKYSAAHLHEKSAQEDVMEGEKIFWIPMTVFSSRVKEIPRYNEREV